MAHKKKNQPAEAQKPAQEVQEVTLPQNDDKDIIFFALQAEYLIKQTAKRYDKPADEVFLIDGLNMLYEDIKENNKTDKEKAESAENAAKIAQAAEFLTGKDKDSIRLADLQTVIKEHLPEERTAMPVFSLTDEELEAIKSAIAAAVDFSEMTKALKEGITAITQTIDFKAITEGIKDTLSFLSDMALNADQIAEISGRALEFEREILPYIMLEIADRTGYKYALQLSAKDVRRIMQGEATPEEYNEDFENAFSEACQQFALDGTPTSQYGHELLEAAAKRKAALIKDGQTIGALVNFAEVLAENTTDTEQAELIKKQLPTLKEELKELKELPLIIDRKPTNLIKPTDRISNELTQPITKDKLLTTGQKRFAMVTDGEGRGVPVTLGIVFNKAQLEAAGIKADITPYDITLQQAIHTIRETCYKEGFNIGKHGEVYTTPNQIWAQMGGKSKLNKGNQRTKFFNAIQKNNTTQCDIETELLLKQYSADKENTGKDVKVKDRYVGNFIDVRIYERGIIDGRERECIIAIFSDPLLTEFAADLNQLSKVPLYVLRATGALTDDNLAVANYLQHAIIYMKRHPRNTTINLESLKTNTGTIKRDNNLKKYVEELLTEYSHPPKGETPFINGFTPVKTGYKIILDKPIRESITQKKPRSRKNKP